MILLTEYQDTTEFLVDFPNPAFVAKLQYTWTHAALNTNDYKDKTLTNISYYMCFLLFPSPLGRQVQLKRK